MHMLIEVAPGELVDKLTILDIKLEKIDDEDKLKNIKHERHVLFGHFEALRLSFRGNKQEKTITKIDPLMKRLKEVNLKIWEIEDDIRECERQKDFGDKFIGLARGVYFNNDERCRLKREINDLCGSEIIEEKSHEPY